MEHLVFLSGTQDLNPRSLTGTTVIVLNGVTVRTQQLALRNLF